MLSDGKSNVVLHYGACLMKLVCDQSLSPNHDGVSACGVMDRQIDPS